MNRPDFWIFSFTTDSDASSCLRGSSRNSMLVNPSFFANSRLASENWPRTPSFGFQLGARLRCAWAEAARERAVRALRREMFIILDKAPTFAEFRLEPLIGFVVVGEAHLRSVPLELALVFQGDYAEQHPLHKGSGDREVGARRVASLAGADKVAVMAGRA